MTRMINVIVILAVLSSHYACAKTLPEDSTGNYTPASSPQCKQFIFDATISTNTTYIPVPLNGSGATCPSGMAPVGIRSTGFQSKGLSDNAWISDISGSGIVTEYDLGQLSYYNQVDQIELVCTKQIIQFNNTGTCSN